MKDKKGFGLAETLIASAILSSLVLVFYGVSSSINRNIARTNERSVAALLAQQEMENIKHNKEKNWHDSRSLNANTDSWDSEVVSGSNTNINSCSQWTVTTNPVYVKQICLYRNNANQLPVVTFHNNSSNQEEALAFNQYNNDYLVIVVNLRWNGVVSNSQYTLSGIITNWQSSLL